MDIKLKFTIPLPEGLVDSLDIDEETLLKAYIIDGKLVVTTLDEDDFDDYMCDGDCDNCPFNDEDKDDDCPIGVDDCDDCEYFCPYCGECIYDEEN